MCEKMLNKLQYFVLMITVVVIALSGCVSGPSTLAENFLLKVISLVAPPASTENPWPVNTSFVVIDEEPDTFISGRTENFIPSVHRVVLLPIVLNYLWEGKRHQIALADPFAIEPGKESLYEMMDHLEKNEQTVWSCLVLSSGYYPGTLQLQINHAGIYQDKEVWLIMLAPITEEQYKLVFSSIMSELNQTTFKVGEELSFEQALQKQRVLTTRRLRSPIIHSDGFRINYILWTHYAGTLVDVCISETGMKLLKDELGSVGEE